jgi:hypothetical protein
MIKGPFAVATTDPISRATGDLSGCAGVDVAAVALENVGILRTYLDVPSDDRLVCGNDRLAGTVWPDVDDGLADDVENRLGRVEVIGCSSTTRRTAPSHRRKSLCTRSLARQGR